MKKVKQKVHYEMALTSINQICFNILFRFIAFFMAIEVNE